MTRAQSLENTTCTRQSKIDSLINRRFPDYEFNQGEIEICIQAAGLARNQSEEQWRRAVEGVLLQELEKSRHTAATDSEADVYESILEMWKYKTELLKMPDDRLAVLYDEEKT